MTNGITPRRWLRKANPDLSAIITDRIGGNWCKNLDELKNFEKFADDPATLKAVMAAKRANKVRLAEHIQEICGVTVNPDSIFDVQVKRLHAST